MEHYLSFSNENILYLIAFFFLYSFLWWIIDSTSRTYNTKSLQNWWYLYWPFCPIYWVPCVFMIVYMNYLDGGLGKFIIWSIVILTVWEYIVWKILEIIFNKKFWDYSDEPYNLDWLICVKTSLAWGLLAVLFIKLIHPFFNKIIYSIPYDKLLTAVELIIIILVVDLTVSTFKHIKNRFASVP